MIVRCVAVREKALSCLPARRVSYRPILFCLYGSRIVKEDYGCLLYTSRRRSPICSVLGHTDSLGDKSLVDRTIQRTHSMITGFLCSETIRTRGFFPTDITRLKVMTNLPTMRTYTLPFSFLTKLNTVAITLTSVTSCYRQMVNNSAGCEIYIYSSRIKQNFTNPGRNFHHQIDYWQLSSCLLYTSRCV